MRAANDGARWMIGDASNEAALKPATPPRAPVDDELAIVRAIQDVPGPVGDENDAYTETELTEVDGIYDIVPGDDSQMDALYDMLASFDEDSVKIYAGLVHPNPVEPPVLAGSAPSAETPSLPEGARVDPLYVPDDVAAREAPVVAPVERRHDPDDADIRALEDAEPKAAPEASHEVVTEPEQPSLLDEPAPAKTPRRTKRASVPTWDEIMFGAPRPGRGKG